MKAILWIVQQVSESNATYVERVRPLGELFALSGIATTITTYDQVARDLINPNRALNGEFNLVVATKPARVVDYLVLDAISESHHASKIVIDVNDDYLPKPQDIRDRFEHTEESRVTLNALSVGYHFRNVWAATPEIFRRYSKIPRTSIMEIMDIPYRQSCSRLDYANLQTTRNVKIVWFGIADNPHYSAGLDVLLEGRNKLRDLTIRLLQSGFDPEVVVLTNLDHVSSAALNLLRETFSRITFRDWNPDSFNEILRECQIAYLPRGGSVFNCGKGLNRVFTAIASGHLVLTGGSKSVRSDRFPLTAVVDSPEDIVRLLIDGNRFVAIEASVESLNRMRIQNSVEIHDSVLRTWSHGYQVQTPDSLKLITTDRVNVNWIKFARKWGWVVIGAPNSEGPTLDVEIRMLSDRRGVSRLEFRQTRYAKRLNDQTLSRLAGLEVGCEHTGIDHWQSSHTSAPSHFSRLEVGLVNRLAQIEPTALVSAHSVGIARISELPSLLDCYQKFRQESRQKVLEVLGRQV